jgi:hypothetical protein
MRDLILDGFLRRQHEEGLALARASDLLELFPGPGDPPDQYIARFRCKGLVRSPDGVVSEADRFEVGIWFPSDYLVCPNPSVVLTWFGPRDVFHPNILPPFICVGRMAPGLPLVDLLYQCFDMISGAKVTMREDDALNRDACAWARRNLERFPVDRRPLKRRALALRLATPDRGRPA